eukprot:jgi/Chlat1/6394/Chrsp44S05847
MAHNYFGNGNGHSSSGSPLSNGRPLPAALSPPSSSPNSTTNSRSRSTRQVYASSKSADGVFGSNGGPFAFDNNKSGGGGMVAEAQANDAALWLRAALSERELELVELREQHMRLTQQSTQVDAGAVVLLWLWLFNTPLLYRHGRTGMRLCGQKTGPYSSWKMRSNPHTEHTKGKNNTQLLHSHISIDTSTPSHRVNTSIQPHPNPSAPRRQLNELAAASSSSHSSGWEQQQQQQEVVRRAVDEALSAHESRSRASQDEADARAERAERALQEQTARLAAVERTHARKNADVQNAMEEMRETAVSELEAECNELRASAWEKESQIAELQLARQRQETTIAQYVVSSLQGELRAASATIADLQAAQEASLQVRDCVVLRAKEDQERIQARVAELQAKMLELQAGVAAKEGATRRAKEQCRQLQASVSSLQHEKAVQDTEIARLQADVLRHVLKSTAEQSEAERDELQHRCAQLQRELDHARQIDTAGLSQRLDKFAEELRQAKHRAQELGAELAKERAARAEATQQLHDFQRQQVLANKRAGDATADTQRERARAAALEAELRGLRSNLARAKEHMQTLTHARDEVQRKETASRQRATRLEAELAETKQQLADTEQFQLELEKVVQRMAARPGSML